MSETAGYNSDYSPMSQSQMDNFHYFNPWQGAPGGEIGSLAAGMAGSYVMGQYGYMPMGMGYQGNLYNSMRQQMFSASHMQAMQTAAQQDMGNMLQFERGLLNAHGIQVGAKETENLQAMNAHMAKIAPFADPFTWNALNGGRSAAVMAHGVHLGGMFRRDPVTGIQGMSGDTSAHVAGGIYQNYFSDANWQYKTAGIDSLGMANMFDEITRRGLMAAPGNDRSRVVAGLDYMRRNGGDVGGALSRAGVDASKYNADNPVGSLMDSLSGEELKKLAGDSGVQDGMRSADTGRIIQTLDKYKGAIAAVREIFGDAGRPNAPMKELFAMLDHLTQGASHQVDPGRMEMMVRNMHNAAKTAGLDMNEMMAVYGAAGQMTDSMGKNPLFASQIASGGFTFMAAYNNLGLGDVPAWGLQGKQQMGKSYMEAYARATNSGAANRLGAAMRLSEQLGGGFGGEMGDLVDNAKNGIIRAQFANMGDSEFITKMVNDTGLDRGTVEKALRATNANDEYIFKNNLGGLVTKFLQPEEFKTLVLGTEGGAFSNEAYSFASKHLGAKGVTNELTSGLARTMANSLMGMGKNLRRDSEMRNIRLASDVETYLKKAAPGSAEANLWDKLSKLSPEERSKQLKAYAISSYTEAEVEAMANGVEGGLENPLTMYDPDTSDELSSVKADVQVKSVLQAAAAGHLNGGSPVMNLMKAIQEGGEDANEASLTKYISKALGGTGKEGLAGRLGADLHGIYQKKQDLEKLKTQAMQAHARGDVGLHKELEAKFKEDSDALGRAETQIKSFMDENKLTDVLGSMVEKPGEAGSGDVMFNNANITINAGDATISVKGGSGGTKGGGAKDEKRGGSPVPASK